MSKSLQSEILRQPTYAEVFCTMATKAFWEKCDGIPNSDKSGAIRVSVIWYEGHSILFCFEEHLKHMSYKVRLYNFDLVPSWFA